MIYGGPDNVERGLVFYCDTLNQRSYAGEPTTNVHPNPLDLYSWCVSGAGASLLYRETSFTSPAGGFPLRMETTGTDPYTFTYESLYWSLTSASQGQTWTYSVWIKSNRNLVCGMYLFECKSDGTYTNFSNVDISVTTEWQRFFVSRTLSDATTTNIQVRMDGPNAYTTGDIVWWDGLQVEQKSHITPFVSGSRSNTQGLLDMTRRNTIDLSNATYDSSANIIYSGGQSVSAGNLGTGFTDFSICCWFKSTSVTSYKNVFDMNYLTYNPNTGNVGPRLEQYSEGTIGIIWSGNTSNNDLYNSAGYYSISPNSWYYFVMTCVGGAMNFYLNGVAVQSNVSSGQGYITSFADVLIGRGFVLDPSRYFNGSIPTFSVYNVLLSAKEVLQLYNATKSRYIR